MYYQTFILIVTLSSINLHITAINAKCNKTLKLPVNNYNNNETNDYKSQHRGYRQQRSIVSGEAVVEGANFNANSRNSSNFDFMTNATRTYLSANEQIHSLNDLDQLRLEYYKYKILNQLGIKEEAILRGDSELRSTQSRLTYNLDKEVEDKKRQLRQLDSINSPTRHKRSLACNQVKSNKDACCLETFYVNFTDIGWDKWIIYPTGYNANYCRGQCDLSHSRYYHSTLLSKFSNVIGLCCSPKQMAPLRLLYIDEENKVHQKTMPDMIVESCDCA